MPVAVEHLVALAVCFGSACHASTARAAPPVRVTLEYTVAPQASGCPDDDEFRASVERQLGYDPFQPPSDRRVVVDVARTASGFNGSIRWTDARGHWAGDRRLSSHRPDCGEIAANLAFAVAVQIQLLAALAPEEAEPAAAPPASTPVPPPTPPPKASATPPSHPRVAPPPEPRQSSLRLSVGLGPSIGFGVAPHATGLGRLFASGRVGAFSLELSGDAILPASGTQPDGSGFSLSRFSAGAAACGHVQAFAACLTAALGQLEARGFGVDKAASPSGLFSQIGLRIAARHDFGTRFFAGARLDGLVAPALWRVTLNDAVAWTTPRVGAVVGLDVGINFL